jgi:FkbM family methyltransferase
MLNNFQNWPELVGITFGKQPVVKLRNGLKFKVRTYMDVWVVKETCLDREYATSNIHMGAGSVAIDIGAAFGDFSILTAYEHPDSVVYAFEPFPESYELLKGNIQLNSVKNIKTFPIAIGAKSGEMTLFATGEAVQHTTTDAEGTAKADSLSVQGISLEELFQKNAISECEVLKIDCEGAEFEILLNTSEDTFKKIKNICLEYHDGFTKYAHTDLVAYLQENGYQVKITPSPVYGYLGFLYASR